MAEARLFFIASREAWWRRLLRRLEGYQYLAGLLVMAAALYIPSLNDPFHGDDYVAFTQFRTTSFLEYCRKVFLFQDSNFYWRPLGKILHRVLFEGFGFDPFVFHLAALVIFLATLACLYAFCLRLGLSRAVALGAVAFFELFPNHVVSVAWVTNTSRLMAVLFFLLCLLVLQMRGEKRLRIEVGAWLLFLAAACSDETVMALAPIVVIYATFRRQGVIGWRGALLRLLAYGLMAVTLIPPQFAHSTHDDPRVSFYNLGPHAMGQFWALASQLTLPLSSGRPLDVFIWSISPLQWAAGLAAILAGAGLFCVGSWRLRFLLLWTGLALTPFALWHLNYTTPRYVYMAALPYSVIVSWGLVSLYGYAVRLLSTRVPWPNLTRRGLALATAGSLAALVLLFVQTDLDRNASWGQQSQKYGVFASNLRRQLPKMPQDSRIYILYDDLPDFWATSVAQTVYGDRSIRVIGIQSSDNLVRRAPPREGDVLMYDIGDQLIPADPAAARAQ